MKKLLILLVACSSCAYDTSFSDCTVRCTADLECPVGLACGDEGLCREPGIAKTCTVVLDTRPSCTGLPATCGPAGDEDCCASPLVPGGTYYRSYDVAGDGLYPSMAYPATVSPFMLDRFEVTVGRFRSFVEAGQGTRASPPIAGAGAHAKIAGSGWDPSWNVVLVPDTAALVAAVKCNSLYRTWTDAAGANESLPINCVDWYEALAFCAWDGGFLPTEAEWNFAAAGGSEQRAYPWSSPAGSTTIDCSYANYEGCGTGATPVGSKPQGKGRWGHEDLAGNVYEWTLDWLDGLYKIPCIDCAALTVMAHRMIRNSSFGSNTADLRGASRNHYAPGTPSPDIGVRCARPANTFSSP